MKALYVIAGIMMVFMLVVALHELFFVPGHNDGQLMALITGILTDLFGISMVVICLISPYELPEDYFISDIKEG